MDIEFYLDEAFADKVEFDTDVQKITAIRYATAPQSMRTRYRRKLKGWASKRGRAEQELRDLIDPLVDDPSLAEVRQLKTDAQAWIERWAYNAFQQGMDAAGVKDLGVSDVDLAWLNKHWFKREWRYLERLIDGVRDETVSAAMAKVRLRYFARSLDAVFYVGVLSCFPAKGTVIYWRLGVSEHCPDCLRLAKRKRYTLKTLPTTPRNGETRCMSNCRCWLDITFTPKKAKVVKMHGREEPVSVLASVLTHDPIIMETGIEPGSLVAEILHPLLGEQGAA